MAVNILYGNRQEWGIGLRRYVRKHALYPIPDRLDVISLMRSI